MIKLRSTLLGLCLLSSFVSAAEGEEDDKLPLDAERSIQLSLDEATWLSLDLSPDDQTLVIEVLGDLYTLPIAGGVAEPLLTRMAFDSQPVWSPDGKYIAYISDQGGNEDLWIYNVETKEEQKLSKGTARTMMASPAWSPDSQRVFVSKRTLEMATYEIWTYAVDGGSGVQITFAKTKPDVQRAQQHNALGPVVSPDQRYVYYARKAGGSRYNQTFPSWQIARRDLSRGKEDILTNAAGSAMRPNISHSGEYLVYGTRHQQGTGLRIRHLTSGQDKWLVYPIQRDDQESWSTRDLLPGYAFTSDDESLLTTKDGKLIRVDLETSEIQNIPFRINASIELGQRAEFSRRVATGPVRARILEHIQVAPDGERVAFTAFNRIYVHSFADETTTPLSPEALHAGMPTWSPNGRDIAYVAWAEGEGAIFRQRARKGAKPKRLTNTNAYYSFPAWSPDGERIVAVRGSAAEFGRVEQFWSLVTGSEIIWVDANGGDDQFVIPARGLSKPHFGPEFDRIYLHISVTPLPRGATMGIVSVRYDGTDRRQHISATAPGIYYAGDRGNPERMILSPDGQHLLVKHAHQLYLAKPLPQLKDQKFKLNKPNIPLVKLTDVGMDYMAWSPDGNSFVWTSGNQIYHRSLSTVTFSSESDDDDESLLLEDHASNRVADVAIYRPRFVPEGQVALTGGTVLNPRMGASESTVVVSGDRIERVEDSIEVSLTDDVEQIDVTGMYLLPGFIDTHAHFRALAEINDRQTWAMLANLAYGVTSGMDVQPTTVSLFSVKDSIDAGLSIGPRAFSTGPGVFNDNEFKSYEQTKAVLTRYKERYQASTIKAYLSGSRKQRQWLIKAANEVGLNVTTEGALDLKMDLTLMMDGFTGLEHALPLPTVYEDVIQLAGKTRLAYTPTLLVAYGGPFGENYFYTRHSPYKDEKLRRFTPYDFIARRALRGSWFHEDEHVFPKIAASAYEVEKAGGQIGIGAHGQLQGLGFHWEMWALAAGGMPNEGVLARATIGGAEMLGMDQDLGSIEADKLADILVLQEDPRADLKNTLSLKYVMKGGVLYDAETLNQIWPESKPLPEQWWQRDSPIRN